MDTSQHEIYEYARSRVQQKKRLFSHFVIWVVGSFFMFALNKWLGAGAPHQWCPWVVALWLFVLILHFIRVFVTDRFMNQQWERKQIDRLMAKQEKRIGELEESLKEKES